jgi:uncharacterized protein (DUF3084 family)
MNEEQVKAAIEAAKAEAVAAAEEKYKLLETNMNNVVEELKNTRKTKQEIEAERDALKAKAGQNDPTDVDVKIQEALAQKEAREIESIKNNSIRKFKETHKEFHPDNDPAGVKYAAFEQRLARINLNGLTTEEQFMEAFDDAFIILNKGTQQTPQTRQNPYASTTQHTASPKTTNDSGLTAQEETLIKKMGWDEARYLKIKKSRPEYVKSLLKFNQ